MILYLLLFLVMTLGSYTWYMKEHLTLEEVNRKVQSLSKNVKKIDNDLKSQEKRMGVASAQAASAQALLTTSKA
jgi:hypothetical protein